jgi:hypothetical protein
MRDIEPSAAVTAHPFLRRQLEQHSRLTSTPAGRVREPLLVQEAEMVSALYLVDADATRALIMNPPHGERKAAPRVRVLRLPVTGEAVVLFSVLQYKTATLEPYSEIAIQVLAYMDGHERRLRRDLLKTLTYGIPEFLRCGLISHDALFAYVLALPVSTEQAQLVGQGLYNMPKYVSAISVERSQGDLIVDDGAGVNIRVPRQQSLSLPMMPFPAIGTNSPNADGVLRCEVAVPPSARLRYSLGGTIDIAVAPSAPTTLAATMRALRLPDKKPRLILQDDAFKIAFLPASSSV